jgi:hypothetical protein
MYDFDSFDYLSPDDGVVTSEAPVATVSRDERDVLDERDERDVREERDFVVERNREYEADLDFGSGSGDMRVDERDASDGVAPRAEYSCSQCAEFASSIDMMAFAGDCMMGPSASCCSSLLSFEVEPCVHTLMDGMPAAFVPIVQDILTGCALTLALKCGILNLPSDLRDLREPPERDSRAGRRLLANAREFAVESSQLFEVLL